MPDNHGQGNPTQLFTMTRVNGSTTTVAMKNIVAFGVDLTIPTEPANFVVMSDQFTHYDLTLASLTALTPLYANWLQRNGNCN
jgi:hypothetical protein